MSVVVKFLRGTSGNIALSGNLQDGQPAVTTDLGQIALIVGMSGSQYVIGPSTVAAGVASGSIGQYSLASGAVNSGQVSSGAVLGHAGGGAFDIASGTINNFDIASGSLTSGLMASGFLAAFTASVTLTSGQVVSGLIGNNAVNSGNISSGAIGQYQLSSGCVVSGDLGNNVVVSGSVASGILAHPMFANAAVQSGDLASGQISVYHLQSGLVSGLVLSGQVGSGQLAAIHTASGLILPGTGTTVVYGLSGITVNATALGLSSGIVTSGYLGNTSVVSGSYASGSISQFALASGAVNSGQLASGSVQGFFGSTRDVASGTLGVFDFGSGAVIAGTIGSGAVQSGNITSGSVGINQLSSGLASGLILSGQFGSGQASTYVLASGTTTTRAEFTGPFFSGTNWTATTQQIVSGIAAVSLSQSGTLQVAMASVSGTMPAIGLVVDNVASGIQANVYTLGAFQLPVSSGMMVYSGYLGQPVYVGRSGQVVTASGALNSGGFLSGDLLQPLGVVWNSGGVVLDVGSPYVSGGQPSLTSGNVQSGNIASGSVGQFALSSGCVVSGDVGNNAVVSGSHASGQISQFALASGTVNSGQLASGVVLGQAGGGAFNIASGTINKFDLGSGAIVSGNIASGQIGFGHLANNSVQSGTLASGQVSQFALASGAVNSGQVASGAVIGRSGGGTFTIASGTISLFDIAAGGIASGSYASGSIASGHLASGVLLAIAANSVWPPRYIAGLQLIWTSGGGVNVLSGSALDSSGLVNIALASTISINAIASGTGVTHPVLGFLDQYVGAFTYTNEYVGFPTAASGTRIEPDLFSGAPASSLLQAFPTRLATGGVIISGVNAVGVSGTKFLSQVAVNDLIYANSGTPQLISGTQQLGTLPYAVQVATVTSDSAMTLTLISGYTGSGQGTSGWPLPFLVIEQPIIQFSGMASRQVNAIGPVNATTVALTTSYPTGGIPFLSNSGSKITFGGVLNNGGANSALFAYAAVQSGGTTGGMLSTQRSVPLLVGAPNCSGGSGTPYISSFRRIGSVICDTSGSILTFQQHGDNNYREVDLEIADAANNTRVLANGSATSWTVVSTAAVAPPTASEVLVLMLWNSPPNAGGLFSIRPNNLGVDPASLIGTIYIESIATTSTNIIAHCGCDGAQQIKYTLNAANTGAYIDFRGYRELV